MKLTLFYTGCPKRIIFTLPENIAKRPYIFRVSSKIGFSFDSKNVEVISTDMKNPTAVDLTSTGIISAAIREGITP